jgi:hypothetical protein
MFIYIGPNCIITFTVDKYVNTPHTKKNWGSRALLLLTFSIPSVGFTKSTLYSLLLAKTNKNHH